MKDAIRTCYLGLIVLWVFPSNSHAYLDPSSGTNLLQVLVGILAAGSVSISMYRNKLKSLFVMVWKKDKVEK